MMKNEYSLYFIFLILFKFLSAVYKKTQILLPFLYDIKAFISKLKELTFMTVNLLLYFLYLYFFKLLSQNFAFTFCYIHG